MDYHYLKLSLSGILQELTESRAFGDRVGMRGFPFFSIASAWDPTSGLAEFMKEPFLGIQGMTFYLRRIRDSDISHRPHSPTSPPSRPWAALREAIARATSARVLRKCSTA